MSDPTLPGRQGSSVALRPEEIEALRSVPSGAVALSALAVGLLLVAWLLIYLMVYLPRGMVG